MKKLRIHYLQHVPFEGIGYIESWAEKHGHTLSSTKLFKEALFPGQDEFDCLLIMGGPMGIYQEKEYAWLKAEKEFIKKCIELDKKVLGICLGSQLIAEVLGAKVYPNDEKEIGWFPVSVAEESEQHVLLKDFPKDSVVMHWHGDTFDLPKGSIRLLETSVCKNQAFLYKNNVLGLQFHLESTAETLQDIVSNCADELVAGTYIQSASEILSAKHLCQQTNRLLDNLFNRFINLEK